MAENKAGRPVSKSAMYQSLAEATGLSRKQIASVFERLARGEGIKFAIACG